jgi:hypothetical protein
MDQVGNILFDLGMRDIIVVDAEVLAAIALDGSQRPVKTG